MTEFSTRKLTLLAIFFVVAASSGLAQNTPNVALGQNGIKMNVGTLNVNGNDIEDAGTTVWDQNNGYIPSSQVQDNWIDESGDKLTGILNVTSGNLITSDELKANSSSSQSLSLRSNGDMNFVANQNADSVNQYEWKILSSNGVLQGDDLEGTIQGVGTIREQGNILLRADRDGSNGGPFDCDLTADDGSFDCDGTKNWVHDLNQTHEAVYTSQESPEVRAVYEGKAHIQDSKRIELPSHFSKTVSDSKPMLRAQVTPQGTFTKAVVMDKTDDYVEIKVGKETDVNFRITGIREGYKDKQVVRPK